MKVVDTSALMAVLLEETDAGFCWKVLEQPGRLLMSAGTYAESLIVAARRGVGVEMAHMIEELGIEIVPLTADSARRTARAYDRWGKGSHPAGLNFGDCFAYELATHLACPLLFVGNDFSRTDITAAA